MALVALIVAGILYLLVGQLEASTVQRQRDEATTRALAQAKEALISYAVSVDLSGSARPGDLPCPDNWSFGHNNAGTAGSDLVSLAPPCSTPAKRIGRLPWRTLKITELHDGSGESLWYAVSTNFKNNPRSGTLNSDTAGTISVRDGIGNLVFDASAGNGVVAVIMAPGPPMQRQDGLVQQRNVANFNVASHYLDNIATEDNADFSDGTPNGFFIGPAYDAIDPRRIIANDRIVFITRDEIMAAIEKRVAAEVLNCLAGYAAYKDLPSGTDNKGHYPWAADLAASAGGNYSDTLNTKFGRIPDLMCHTGGSGVGVCTGIVGSDTNMLWSWGSVPNCYITSNWFPQNWREQVFYAIADAFKPGAVVPSGCPSCLSLDSASGRQAVVLLGRRIVGAQQRSSTVDKVNAANYLEDVNNLAGTAYVTKSAAQPFNDLVLSR